MVEGIEKDLVEVAVALPIHRTFLYAVPEKLTPTPATGKRVLVPFGRRRVTGYVLGASELSNGESIKDILEVLDESPLFPETMVNFVKWISEYYMYPMGLVLKNALPSGLQYSEQTVLSITERGIAFLEKGILTPLEKRILSFLRIKSSRATVIAKNISSQIPKETLLAMLNNGWVCKQKRIKKDRTQPRMERFVSLSGKEIQKPTRLSKSRKKIIEFLRIKPEATIQELKAIVPNSPRLVKAMEVSGQIRIQYQQVYRDPLGEPVVQKKPPVLTSEQNNIVREVKQSLGGKFAAFLLAGITGSGKTEVYLQLAKETIKKGLSVIVLVPEIALISQMERRFRSRFGDRIAILHSGLTPGQRYDQWLRIARGDIQIAIGARSVIFAPFKHVGLIVVDEEHDLSYKQESALRYNARDLAIVRAKQQHAVALLGSATPSIQSYHNAITNKYTQVNLTKRVQKRHLPEISVVDLCRLRHQRGYRRYFSKELLVELEKTLQRGEQAILFLNRRGFANLPICGSCGNPIQCKNCDISLTYHQRSNAYRCHYCGFSMAAKTICPSCSADKIRHLGFGTEKIESIVTSLFPGKNIARMDRDTVSRKGSLVRILKGLKDGSIDILIGTQMVAKGHDFPNITLVGIICADLSLSFPDFRAGEQTFQLIAQVSGRAGRGDRPGKVVLQTYNPKHFSIECAKNQNIKKFYEKEIVFRQSLNYPPFSRMVQIIVTSKDKEKGIRYTKALGSSCNAILRKEINFAKNIIVMGPLEAPYSKIASKYRWQVLIKGSAAGVLHQYTRLLLKSPTLPKYRQVKLTVDVDPFFMM